MRGRGGKGKEGERRRANHEGGLCGWVVRGSEGEEGGEEMRQLLGPGSRLRSLAAVRSIDLGAGLLQQ